MIAPTELWLVFDSRHNRSLPPGGRWHFREKMTEGAHDTSFDRSPYCERKTVICASSFVFLPCKNCPISEGAFCYVALRQESNLRRAKEWGLKPVAGQGENGSLGWRF